MDIKMMLRRSNARNICSQQRSAGNSCSTSDIIPSFFRSFEDNEGLKNFLPRAERDLQAPPSPFISFFVKNRAMLAPSISSPTESKRHEISSRNLARTKFMRSKRQPKRHLAPLTAQEQQNDVVNPTANSKRVLNSNSTCAATLQQLKLSLPFS